MGGLAINENYCKDTKVARQSNVTEVSAVRIVIFNLSCVVVPISTTHVLIFMLTQNADEGLQ